MPESTVMSESMVGGWTTFSCDINKEANDVFKTALKGHVGVNYTPIACASQVVEGMNYSFFCNAKGVYPDARNQVAMIDIYQPPNGMPSVMEIRLINA